MRRVGIIRPEAALAALWALAGAGCGAAGPGEPPTPPGAAETPPPVPACQTAPRLPTFHRLNRTEYHNSVNALLGTQLPLRPSLPPDALLYGFDNNADAPVSAPLVQRYLEPGPERGGRGPGRARQPGVADSLRASTAPACRRQVLQRFLPRAFRRPVDRRRGRRAPAATSTGLRRQPAGGPGLRAGGGAGLAELPVPHRAARARCPAARPEPPAGRGADRAEPATRWPRGCRISCGRAAPTRSCWIWRPAAGWPKPRSSRRR